MVLLNRQIHYLRIKVFSAEKFLYAFDVSENSNNKTTGLTKNEKKNGKLTVIMIGPCNCYLKREVNLV